jgi:hypothetical protein
MKSQFRPSPVVDSLVIGLAAFFCMGTILAHFPQQSPRLPKVTETFDPALQSITSLDEAAQYVRAKYHGGDPNVLADAADEFVRERFFHSYSFFGPKENWLAYLAGFVWIDLRSPVLPDDILHHPQAACSQQVIVFEALVRKLGLDAGSVHMDHHLAAAAKLAGRWRVYDADREINPRSYPLSGLLAGDPAVLAIYGKVGQSIDLAGQAAHGGIKLADVNANPAPHASIFHRVTKMFSSYGWALFLAFVLVRIRRRQSAANSNRFSAAGFAG